MRIANKETNKLVRKKHDGSVGAKSDDEALKWVGLWWTSESASDEELAGWIGFASRVI